MSSVRLRVRAWLRANWARGLLVAVLAGSVAGAVLGLAAGARRTASAPDRYTARVGGDPDLSLAQPLGASLADDVRTLPGVTRVQSVTFVTAFPFDHDGQLVFEPNPFAGDDTMYGARVVAGRFTDPTAPDEFTVDRSLARRLGGNIGDRFEFIAYDQEQTDRNAFDLEEVPAVPKFPARLVGIIITGLDFDESYPTLTFSQAFTTAHPTVGRVATVIAVRTEPGVDPAQVLDAARALPGGADVYAEPARIVSDDSRRAVRFHVTGLWVATAIAAVGAALVFAQLTARSAGSSGVERDALRTLGWRRSEMAAEATIEALAIGAMAALVAAMVTVAVSPLFPIGVMRGFEIDRGIAIDWVVIAVGAAALLAVAAVAGALSALVIGHRTPSVARFSVADAVARAGAPMPFAVGTRFALSRGSQKRSAAWPVALGALCCAGLVASTIVGVSLLRVSDEPFRYGVNYDQLFGNPYLPTAVDIVSPVRDDPEVEALTAATTGSLAIGGRDVPVTAVDPIRGGILPPAVEGRAPSAPDEIGLGRAMARQLRVGVGDVVTATGPTGTSKDLRVVGFTVTAGDAGDGAAMTFDGYAGLAPDATRNILLVRFRDGADSQAADRIAQLITSPPGVLNTPTSVRALERVTPAPFALAIALTMFAVIAVCYSLVVSVRDRWRDLAVLRALGTNSRQLRSTLHWQATVLAVVVVAFGLPLGVVIGSVVFALLADNVGVVSDAYVPLVFLPAVMAVAVVITNLAALGPGRRAARTQTIGLLRDR